MMLYIFKYSKGRSDKFKNAANGNGYNLLMSIHKIHRSDEVVHSILLVLWQLNFVQWGEHEMSDVFHKW